MGKVKPRGTPDELQDWQAEVLLHGQPILNCRVTEETWRAWRDSGEARAAWGKWRDELLEEYSRIPHADPPFAVYAFEWGKPAAEYFKWKQEQRKAKFEAYEAEQAERLGRIEARKKAQTTDGTGTTKPN